jgi:kumamolisin
MGITITVASGDNGSTDGVGDGRNHVDFPASSPHVLACGGTTLHASNGSITDEVVWNETANREGATGGGVSSQFKLPSWQNHLHVKTTSGERALKNRGVPDVSGDADPETGYTVRVDGVDTVIGGTSAVAPLWAALIAILNGSGSNVGFIPPMLYGDPGALHDITSGNNGAYVASPGWDACTGLGTPNGPQLATMTMTINRGAQAPKVATATTP